MEKIAKTSKQAMKTTLIHLTLLILRSSALVSRELPTIKASGTSVGLQREQNVQSFSLEDLEFARHELEELLASTKSSTQSALSYACRRRRQLEIRLLKSLATSDDAIDELVSIWMHEFPSDVHGVDALHVLEQYCSLPQAEQVLEAICAEHDAPVWSEPHCRLALVYLMQNRHEPARACLDRVLQYKPWHFEAVQMQVLLSLASGDRKSAIVWARRGLPSLSHPNKRMAWVQRAVQEAQQRLEELEISEATARRNEEFPAVSAWQ